MRHGGVHRQGGDCKHLHTAVLLGDGTKIHPEVHALKRRRPLPYVCLHSVLQSIDGTLHRTVVHEFKVWLAPSQPLVRNEDNEVLQGKVVNLRHGVQHHELACVAGVLIGVKGAHLNEILRAAEHHGMSQLVRLHHCCCDPQHIALTFFFLQLGIATAHAPPHGAAEEGKQRQAGYDACSGDLRGGCQVTVTSRCRSNSDGTHEEIAAGTCSSIPIGVFGADAISLPRDTR
mmetsp:Transcript_48006/g.154883  ORF Transcript_48006/g.154883 Transcript_48006/m.154883 type:complete len:231 (-) Transcript_48006:1997-2689(-)